MKFEDWPPIITLIVLVIGFVIGFITGVVVDWETHRQFCDCKLCTWWRTKASPKAKRKTSEKVKQADDK